MERHFCDICEAPAMKDLSVEVERSVGEPYSGFRTEQGCQGQWQCKIVVRPVLNFKNHPQSFSGAPDLCHSCFVKLLEELTVKIKESTAVFSR